MRKSFYYRRMLIALWLSICLLGACGKATSENADGPLGGQVAGSTVSEDKPGFKGTETQGTDSKVTESKASEPVQIEYATIIYVTINPKLALYLDENDVVIAVDCLNQDASQITDEVNLVGEPVEQCMKLIVETAIEKEFLHEGKEVQIEIAQNHRQTDPIDNTKILQQIEKAIDSTTANNDMNVVVKAESIELAKQPEGFDTCPECRGTGACIWCETAEVCRACNGKQEIVCDTCQDGKVACHKCNGESRQEATTRTIEVEYCTKCGARRDGSEGVITSTCTICNGTGYHSCHACRGAKGFNCWTCNGGYETCCSDPNCPRCQGSGSAICGQCDNGWRTCNECGGTGREACRECSGGTTSCPHPGDAVEIRTETVEEQADDSGVCDSCNGTGTERCPSCGGEYRRPCGECSGTGKTRCSVCEETGRCKRCDGSGRIEE